MGHIKDIANQPKLQSFPNSTFEIQGIVPASQCSEAQVQGTGTALLQEITEAGNFIGWNLTGKKVTVTAPPAKAGTYDIINNNDNTLFLIHDFGIPSVLVDYYCHNGGALILTRDITSFAAFISAAGYSYTIKGAKLYTNIPSVQLQPACSILFDPLT